ncbi:MAG TPA: hypothetical protein VKF38_04300 [Anaerolineaceae bacterium]|nr:hypothetical protein [Anaerolineaceae bacterium]
MITKKMQQIDQFFEENPIYRELFWVTVRWIILIGGCLVLAIIGGLLFETIDTRAIAEHLRATVPVLSVFPTFVLVPFIFIFDPDITRYMLAPLYAVITVVIAGGFFIRDVYELESLKQAIQYVISSLFGLNYPQITIDGGEVVLHEDEVNVLNVIGGPGFAVIQPGNAVLFRSLRRPSKAGMTRSYFMAPFEVIGQVASLDDQHGFKDKLTTLTKDGIQVTLCDVHFRFRIMPIEENGLLVDRSLENPYPYSEEALSNMAYNLSVEAKGLETWHEAVKRMVVGGITEYINSHTIDHLTAPFQNGQDPHSTLHDELFSPASAARFKNLGAELLWVDVGHIEIVSEEVDKTRLDLWAADWIGNADVARAYGDAKRQAYQELGRAEAQAEIIIGITQSLEQVEFNEDPAQNLQKMLLLRTAQVLEAMTEKKPKKTD